MLQRQLANGVDVVVPDRVDQLTGEDEPRPARRPVAAREHELRIGELRALRRRRLWMVLLDLRDGIGFAAANGAEQILRLVPELFQVGTDGQATIGHDEPP